MAPRFRFLYAILHVTAALILTVFLRNSSARLFHQLWVTRAEQSRLKQQLGNKQLQLENLISPSEVSKCIEQ